MGSLSARKEASASPKRDWTAKNTVKLAKSLLGQVLARRMPDGSVERRIITEVEAYDGETDLASHARVGRTPRTEVLYRAGGHWYVYLCYGIHEMLNLVVGPEDHPAAVLIRGVEGLVGPGRLTKGLAINRTLNGLPAHEDSQLWIEDGPAPVNPKSILAGPRIGVDFAGPIWSAVPWRFRLPSPESGAGAGGRPKRKASKDRPAPGALGRAAP